jgi:hypothetical protein
MENLDPMVVYDRVCDDMISGNWSLLCRDCRGYFYTLPKQTLCSMSFAELMG